MTSANNAFLGSPDGAHPQAVAVRAYLSYYASGVDASYKDGQFQTEAVVHRWHNCREQGYVVQMVAPAYTGNQINIAFFEHRNSDSICAVLFEANTYGDPATLDHIPDGVYESKHDIAFSVGPGEPAKMAEWIIDQLDAFWKREVTDKPVEVVEQDDEFPIDDGDVDGN